MKRKQNQGKFLAMFVLSLAQHLDTRISSHVFSLDLYHNEYTVFNFDEVPRNKQPRINSP